MLASFGTGRMFFSYTQKENHVVSYNYMYVPF